MLTVNTNPTINYFIHVFCFCFFVLLACLNPFLYSVFSNFINFILLHKATVAKKLKNSLPSKTHKAHGSL